MKSFNIFTTILMCFVISCSNTSEPVQVDCGVIAFSIDDIDIYTINGDGSGFQKIANKPGSDSGPAWSPNGEKIVFYAQINSNTWSLYKPFI